MVRDAWVDHYNVLGLDPSAERAEIVAAYRRLCLVCHPDLSQDPEATEQAALINEARRILSNPTLRQRFDEERQERLASPGARAAKRLAADPPSPPPEILRLTPAVENALWLGGMVVAFAILMVACWIAVPRTTW
jgi:curved DNA-binding protein CbpA